MPVSATTHDVTFWMNGRHVDVAHQVLTLMDGSVTPVGLGGPRAAALDEFAAQFDLRADDDLRHLLVDRPPAFVVLLTHDHVTRDDLRLAIERGATLLAVEPIFANADDLAVLRPTGGTRLRVEHAPAFVRCSGWRSAAEPLLAVGSARSVTFTSVGSGGDRSLYARLFEAWQMVLSVADLPQRIDATLVGPQCPLPDDLRAATGDLLAMARIGRDQAALVHVSDQAGLPFRQLHVLGAQGQLRVGDCDYELHDASGQLLDRMTPIDEPVDFAQLLAEHWRLTIDRQAASTTMDPTPDPAQVLACCQASLLSARTGQPEDTGTFLNLR